MIQNILSLLKAEQRSLLHIAAIPLAEVLAQMVRVFENEEGRSGHGLAMLMSADGSRLTHAASHSLPSGYRELLQEIVLADATCCYAKAARSGEPSSHDDGGAGIGWNGYRDAAFAHGLQACQVFPLRGPDQRVSGIFAMHYPAQAEPTDVDALGAFVQIVDYVICRHSVDSALRESEDQYRHAIELSPHVQWTSAPNGLLDHVSPRWRQWTGTAGLGQSWSDVIHPDDLAPSVAAWNRSVATGMEYDIEHRVRLHDGTYHWMHSRASPRRDDAGNIIKWYGTTEDIEDYIRATDALSKSEQEFRTLAQAIPNHAWAADRHGLIYWFNERVYEYTGAARGKLDGEQWTVVVHPDDLDAAIRNWTQAIETGEPYETEFRLRCHEGNYRWYIARALPVRDAQGAITRWIGTNTDVHDHKTMAAQLAVLNTTLEEQVASRTADRDRMWRLSTDVMMVARFDASITAVNPAWAAVLGWHESELIGANFMSLVHPDDYAATMAEVGRIAQGIKTLRFENRYRHRDGSYRWLSWIAIPENELVHGVGRDITAEKLASEALTRSEEALRQSQKMEAVGKLTGGVAHDFNNVLQVIGGNLQMLMPAMTGDPVARNRLEIAAAAVDRGAKLSSQLLAFARRQPLQPYVTNLGGLVRGNEELLRRALGETIDVETVIAGGLWNTLVDPNQLENVILNLTINARDAMPGGGKLTIELSNAMLDQSYVDQYPDIHPGQYVLLAVSDTGHGMGPDVLKQAFEPFYTTKPEGQGTGLGLSMAYGFVRQSNGHIKIYSEVGHGTVVKIYLPRSLDMVTDIPVRYLGPAIGGAETILVVEDDVKVQATVVDMLTGLGYHVLKADDAHSALSIIKSGLPIDLLFTDVVMPGPLRSPELAKQAKLHLPDLAVLFTSGYTQNAIVHGGRLDPGVELLSKPYRREELARKIRHLLANHKHQASVPELLNAATVTPATAPATGSMQIAVVEDNADSLDIVCQFVQLLGHSVRGFSDAESALVGMETTPVDVLLTDISLPNMSGIELARYAVKKNPALRVIFASGYDRQSIEELDFAVGMLAKPFDFEDLQKMLTGVMRAR